MFFVETRSVSRSNYRGKINTDCVYFCVNILTFERCFLYSEDDGKLQVTNIQRG